MGVGESHQSDARKKKGDCFMETMTLVIGAVIAIAAVVSNFTMLK